MAELLVRVVDKTNPDDLLLDCKLTKRGHVIAVQVDGWPWGLEEVKNPDWRIVRVTGDPVDFSDLLTPEPETDPKNPNPYLQRRAFRLDVDHGDVSKAGLRAFFDDHTTEPIATKSDTDINLVAVSETVVSKIDLSTVVTDAQGTRVVKQIITTQREVKKYPVSALDDAVGQKLAGLNVPFVDADVRANVVVDCDRSLIATITAKVNAIANPNIIGSSPAVIG